MLKDWSDLKMLVVEEGVDSAVRWKEKERNDF
jgi:hypothetical protein